MDWKGQISTTGDVLDRIVVLLLALADLAERAAGAPDARRRLALAFIRRAETVAGDAFGSATAHAAADGPSGGTIAVPRDSPEDAMALAAALRALALIVRAMAAPRRRLALTLAGEAQDRIGHGGLGRLQFVGRFAIMAFLPTQRLDTS